jgi:hypothetical protein
MLKKSALALLGALSLAACDGDGGTGVTGLRRGQFEGEVSGVLDTGLRGDAESGYAIAQGVHDLIVLTDFANDVRVVIYHQEDEFFEGRWRIDDETRFDSEIVAYVEDMRTGETFSSVEGTLDLEDVNSGGIEGSAIFTAESDTEFNDFVTVDVVFNTDFTSNIDFNLSASLSRSEKR